MPAESRLCTVYLRAVWIIELKPSFGRDSDARVLALSQKTPLRTILDHSARSLHKRQASRNYGNYRQSPELYPNWYVARRLCKHIAALRKVIYYRAIRNVRLCVNRQRERETRGHTKTGRWCEGKRGRGIEFGFDTRLCLRLHMLNGSSAAASHLIVIRIHPRQTEWDNTDRIVVFLFFAQVIVQRISVIPLISIDQLSACAGMSDYCHSRQTKYGRRRNWFDEGENNQIIITQNLFLFFRYPARSAAN